MPELLVTAPNGRTRPISIQGDAVSLGRSPSNALAFPDDDGLSRQHLVIEHQEGTWRVRDLGSKNGTFVNGERVTGARRLRPGDRILASCVSIRLTGTDDPRDAVTFDGAPTSGAHATSLREILSEAAPGPRPTVSAVWAFVRAGRELARRRPLAELFGVILDLSLEAVGAERGVLLTFDEGGRLVVQACRGGEFKISATVRDQVLTEKRSLLVEDALADSNLQESRLIEKQGVRSLIAVPLQTDEQVFGLLYVDSRDSDRVFSDDDLTLLTAMANVASIRIERERWEIQKRMLISDNVASLSRLAAALSHELNNPLGALKSSLETLLRAAARQQSVPPSERPRLEALQAELRGSLDASLARMQEVLSRIQRFTNLDRAERLTIDLNELVGDVVALVESEVGDADIEFESGSLPELLCHPQPLNTGLSNLLSFAAELGRRQGTAPRLRVVTSRSDPGVEVRIEVPGVILAKEEPNALFEPAFRVEQGRVAAGNWGLFSARQMIRQQGGDVELQSTETGAALVVRLPLHR